MEPRFAWRAKTEALPEALYVCGRLTLEAAETVGPGDGVGKGEFLELLSGLVDQSLVVPETTDDKALRYGMLEPVREYAREKLEGSGEAVRRRHAVFFLALAEEAEPGLLGSDEAAWLDRLTAEQVTSRLLSALCGSPTWSLHVLG